VDLDSLGFLAEHSSAGCGANDRYKALTKGFIDGLEVHIGNVCSTVARRSTAVLTNLIQGRVDALVVRKLLF